jgi:type VII secretion integral membrane protein EccD
LFAVGAVLDSRLAGDRESGTVVGLGACAFAGLAGFAARHGSSGLFTLDRKALAISGCAAAAIALLVAVAGRLPLSVFGTVTGAGLCAAVGAGAAGAFNASAVSVAAVMAVVLYALTTVSLRIALRAARLRVALLPRTAEELQEDIDPVPEAMLTARTGRAVDYLNALSFTCAAVYVTAFAQLVRAHGLVSWILAAVFSAAILLRAQSLTLAWQRAPLALSGATGLVLVALHLVGHRPPTGRTVAALLLLLCVSALLAAAQWMPGRRLLPIWGQVADIAQLWSSIVLIPLLLQLLHVYSHFRALIK